MKKIKFLITVCFFSFCLLQAQTSYAFWGLFGDSTVESVKSGTMDFDRSTTLGDALEGYQYLLNPTWETFEDSQKRTLVVFTATINMEKVFDYTDSLSSEVFINYVSNGIFLLNRKNKEQKPLIDYIMSNQYQFSIEFQINKDDTFTASYFEILKNGEEFVYSTTLEQVENAIYSLYKNELPLLITLLFRTETVIFSRS